MGGSAAVGALSPEIASTGETPVSRVRLLVKERLEQIIAGCGFADRRMHLFDVTVDSADGSRAALSGRVLSPAHLETLRAALAEKLPGVAVDLSNLRVLRD